MRGRRSGRIGWWPALAAAVVLAGGIVGAVSVLASRGSSPGSGAGQAPESAAAAALATNPDLDPGTSTSGRAPALTLTDQFGQAVSLRSFRGRVVLLAFIDSECTTICPLTTETMVAARRLLGASASRVQLLGIDANPSATAVKDVRAFSQAHEMLHQWHFLTGPLPRLKRVWKAYHVYVQIQHGLIDHTPALFAISPGGQLAKLYLTQMAYAGIDQQAQVLAREAAGLLPGHPRVLSARSYDPVPLIRPDRRVALPRAGGGTIRLGPGRPRLLVFFASWLSETSDLAARLEALDRYQAASGRLAGLVAVDEGSVEPSPSALPRLLHGLKRPLSYPVAVDRSGRLADGYRVRDQPWYALSSKAGRILWSHDGWLAPAALARRVRATLTGS